MSTQAKFHDVSMFIDEEDFEEVATTTEVIEEKTEEFEAA